jgi:hypothetical protein
MNAVELRTSSHATKFATSWYSVLGQNAHYYAIDNDQTIAGNPFGIYDGYTDMKNS